MKHLTVDHPVILFSSKYYFWHCLWTKWTPRNCCKEEGTQAASTGSYRSQGEHVQLTNPERGQGNCHYTELLFYCFTEQHWLISEAQSNRKLQPSHQPSLCGKLLIRLVSEHEIYPKEPSLEFGSKHIKTQNIHALEGHNLGLNLHCIMFVIGFMISPSWWKQTCAWLRNYCYYSSLL